MTAQTTTEPQSTTSQTAAHGIAAVRRVTEESAARTRVLIEGGLKPTAEVFSKVATGTVEFGRGNLDAVAQSTQAYLTGVQDFGRQYLAAVQGLTQHAFEGAKTFAGVRSLKDAMAVQAKLTHASIERTLGEGTKLQQAALKLAEQVYAPLTRRATMALEQAKLSRAA